GNGKTFLDRNIGAMYDCTNTTATGLLYQWGRKDPFTAPYRIKYGTLMATSPTNIMTDHTSVETIAWTIQNPTSFIYLSSGGKWFSDSAQTWETTNKSIYDPCPPGYRVPSVSQLSGLSFNKLDGDNYWDSANARIQESTGQYFAGTGRRYVSSGNPKVDTAKNGYYWARDNTGNNMTTAFTIAGPTDTEAEKVLVSANNHGKYFGYAVRCVAE
ncbi:MAG: hypothetical protein J5764_05065, partial [Bacteroidales bacterium]|nr:hypothetical protein [Bacteroidales bacterium]